MQGKSYCARSIALLFTKPLSSPTSQRISALQGHNLSWLPTWCFSHTSTRIRWVVELTDCTPNFFIPMPREDKTLPGHIAKDAAPWTHGWWLTQMLTEFRGHLLPSVKKDCLLPTKISTHIRSGSPVIKPEGWPQRASCMFTLIMSALQGLAQYIFTGIGSAQQNSASIQPALWISLLKPSEGVQSTRCCPASSQVCAELFPQPRTLLQPFFPRYQLYMYKVSSRDQVQQGRHLPCR